MYTIEQKLIKINKYTRPGIKQLDIRAIVLHYTANPGAGALNHYNYFNNGAGGRFAGAHYFIDKTSILQLIPNNEVAYHANEGGKSNLGYLNNLKVGSYKGNANVASIGIELCIEKDGSYHPETIKRAQWLVQVLIKRYKLSMDRVVTHKSITNKNCPANFDITSFKKGTGTIAIPKRNHIGVARIKVTTLNMREQPNVDSKLIRTLKKDESYKIYSINAEGWIDLGSGWVSNKNNAYANVELIWE